MFVNRPVLILSHQPENKGFKARAGEIRMDSKIVYVHTQDGLVTKVEDSNWNDIKPSVHVAKVAKAISAVTDGCTEVSLLTTPCFL